MTARGRRAATFAAALLGLILLLLALSPKPQLQAFGSSRAVYDREGRLLRLTLAPDERYRLWVPLSRMAPALVQTTLLHEDRWFYYHPGVNPVAMLKAGWRTYVSGDRRVGASTLTMQLARLHFGIESRHIGGKLLQIARALQLEWHYDKDEILEAYLNRVPYGGNIEGAEAASRIYFDKAAADLTLHEALTLTIIPQSPAARLPQPGIGENALTRARSALLARWLENHPEDQERAERLAMPPQIRMRRELPFKAPHAVDYVLARESARELTVTLDLRLQQLAERTLRDFLSGQREIGIRNASVLLVDRRDMGVRALVGSADYFNDGIQGQVDGTRARRSPGSTLKPFIYALGLDQGIILPRTLLKDAPFSLGGYNPENFDREFAGPVTVQDALVRSRNIPAIHVALKLREPTLYEFLRQSGVEFPKDADYYGLALVLGGAELSMHDLARLYAMLGNDGMLRPLRFLEQEATIEGERRLSSAASHLILDMLARNPPPRRSFKAQWTRAPLPVHWKTGTSYAFRDAWTVGSFGPYVLAVWVGNFDGESNPAFIGREAAAPLFFRLVDAIRAQQKITDVRGSPPESLTRVKVCAVSGHLPGPHCKHTVESGFIPGVSPITPCDIHREVFIDKATGLRACDENPVTARREVFEFWPSDLLGIFRRAGIPRRTPPPYLPRCAAENRVAGKPPAITSPREHLTYQYRANDPSQSRLPLTAVADGDVHTLYWFLNERFLGTASPDEAFLVPIKPGEYVVRVLDDLGRGDSRDVRVELAP